MIVFYVVSCDAVFTVHGSMILISPLLVSLFNDQLRLFPVELPVFLYSRFSSASLV